jgi:magnesium transporter
VLSTATESVPSSERLSSTVQDDVTAPSHEPIDSLMLGGILSHVRTSIAPVDRVAPLERAAMDQRARGLRVFLYDSEGEDRQLALDEVGVDQIRDDQLLWIDISDLELVESVAQKLGLTAHSVARIASERNRPELFFHDSYLHLVAIFAKPKPLDYEPSVLDCLVGENWVLTAHHGPADVFERFDERIRRDSPLGRLDAPALLATFLHEHVASYLRESEPFEVELDTLDQQVLTGRANDHAVFKQLVGLRRRVGRLRRLLAPHREVYGLLARPDFELLSGADSTETFDSLTQRTEEALQQLETTREMIVSSFETYTTWTAHRTNKVMKLLTVSSLALLPPTLLASVMGMNSLPRALAAPNAFLITTIVMAGLLVSVLSIARRRGWL